MDTSARTLTGAKAILVPLSHDYLTRLCEIGLDAELWNWVPTKVTTCDEMRRYIDSALADQAKGNALPFAICEAQTGLVVGTTRLGSVNLRDRNAEIGWTWIAKPWQRTGINTESKLLLLTVAFESWECVRVEFTTHARNEQSRVALTRIGATLEGVIRKNRIMPNGSFRDTALYSIIDADWPSVKRHLTARLDA